MTKTHSHSYAHITSLKELRQEQIKLHYKSLIAQKSMALKVMELRYEYDPKRWLSILGEKLITTLTGWGQ